MSVCLFVCLGGYLCSKGCLWSEGFCVVKVVWCERDLFVCLFVYLGDWLIG